MKNALFALVAVTLACASGCGGGAGCPPAIAANAKACASGVFIDATANDPVCLASSGVPLCRGDNDAVCYRCNGASFTDGCTISNPQQVVECVHSCDKC
jgi:hypothetical protein